MGDGGGYLEGVLLLDGLGRERKVAELVYGGKVAVGVEEGTGAMAGAGGVLGGVDEAEDGGPRGGHGARRGSHVTGEPSPSSHLSALLPPTLPMKLSFSLPFAFLALASARTYPLRRLKQPPHLHTRAQVTQDGQVTTSNAGTPFSLRSAPPALPVFLPLTPFPPAPSRTSSILST